MLRGYRENALRAGRGAAGIRTLARLGEREGKEEDREGGEGPHRQDA